MVGYGSLLRPPCSRTLSVRVVQQTLGTEFFACLVGWGLMLEDILKPSLLVPGSGSLHNFSRLVLYTVWLEPGIAGEDALSAFPANQHYHWLHSAGSRYPWRRRWWL